MFILSLFQVGRPFPGGQDNILPQTLATHIPLKNPTPTPFHLAWPNWVRQQVTHDNLILLPSEKQAPTNTCPPRTHLVLGLATTVLPGIEAVSEGCCHAGYSDDDPENASAALGRQSKQAGFPRVAGGLARWLATVLMLQWKAEREQPTLHIFSLQPQPGRARLQIQTLPIHHAHSMSELQRWNECRHFTGWIDINQAHPVALTEREKQLQLSVWPWYI